MAIPPILFKYQSFTPDALSNLTNRQIWFSRPSRFNDPFDCNLRIDRSPIPDSDYQRICELYKTKNGNPVGFDAHYSPSASENPKFRDKVKSGLGTGFESRRQVMQNERGVCCFSALNDEILMWSHYADGHKGFCLGFKTDCEPFSGAFQVKYRTDIPSINPASILFDDLEDALHEMITTKFRSWSYEEEWRLIHMEADKAYSYSSGVLESVYFGSSMPESQQVVIGKLLDGTDTKFYRMERNPDKFSVCPKPLTFQALP